MTARHCPKCKVPKLQQKLSDGITRIDVCPSCVGGWFDATELARVLSVAVERLSAPGDAELSDRPEPANLKEAAIQFVERILIRFDMV